MVEVADTLKVLPEGYRFERVFPEAGEFEARHRAAGLHRWYFASAEGISATKAAEGLEGIPGIVSVEMEPELKTDAIPFNDPYRTRQWHLFNDGSINSKFVSGADLNVVPVWNEFTAGTNNVIVGVVDSGVQYDHPDLSGVVIPAGANGSKSFLNSESDPYHITPQRHGTHVAGIIGAINNNGTGVCGIAGGKNGSGGVRILDCAAIAAIEGDIGNVYNAIIWAADHGAVILNNSWNSAYSDESNVPDSTPSYMKLVLDYFIEHAGTDSGGNQKGPMKGGLVVFSAGNKSWQKSQPSMYEKNISVGALGPAGESSYYTNYGDWVDIAAPGGSASGYSNTTDPQVYSTMAGSGYYQMQGTSQAAPCVSGVAALIVSYFGGPGFTPDRLRQILIGGADREKMASHSRYIGPVVDAYGSFLYGRNEPVNIPEDIKGYQTEDNLFGISWTMCKYGSQNIYKTIIAISEDASELQDIDPLNLPSGLTTRTILGSSYSPGVKVDLTIPGLAFDKDYYYTMVSYTRSHLVSTRSDIGHIKLRNNTGPTLTSDYLVAVSLDHNTTKVFTAKYNDPDGDALEIKLNGGSSAATWQDDGAGTLTLTINGKDAPAGSYVAAASVSDGICTEEISIQYTILPNKNPVVGMSGYSIIDPQPIQLKYKDVVEIYIYFVDNDGDEVTTSYTPGSPADEWTDNGNDNYTVTIRGDAAPAGTYASIVNYTDGYYHGGFQIRYTLIGNHAPYMPGSLPDMITMVGKTEIIDLPDFFRDPDGDVLIYSLLSAEGVRASLDGSTLSIVADGPGVGTISVSASDGIAPPIEASFRVSARSSGVKVAEIYPSTVTDKLTVQGVSEGSNKIQIYNSTGRSVYSKEVRLDPYNPLTINVSGLAPGRYTVMVSGSHGSIKQSIVKI